MKLRLQIPRILSTLNELDETYEEGDEWKKERAALQGRQTGVPYYNCVALPRPFHVAEFHVARRDGLYSAELRIALQNYDGTSLSRIKHIVDRSIFDEVSKMNNWIFQEPSFSSGYFLNGDQEVVLALSRCEPPPVYLISVGTRGAKEGDFESCGEDMAQIESLGNLVLSSGRRAYVTLKGGEPRHLERKRRDLTLFL